jgi:serine/threonine protein kinase
MSFPLNNPSSPERRMVLTRYVAPEFEEVLETYKSINHIINTDKAVSTAKSGASSEASIYILPNGKKYIIRQTPGGLQKGLRLRRELELYKALKSDPEYHKFISNLVYGDAHLAAGTKKSYFIFEHEDGDTLDDYIEKHKGTMTVSHVLDIYHNLQEAIDFLESKGVVHRDLKPENIYMSYERGIPLLFDFDAGCTGSECSSVEYTGSPKYSTPGSLTIRGQEGFSTNTKIYKYSPIYDRHALAVILGEDLIKLVKPRDRRTIEEIANKDIKTYVSENADHQILKGGSRMNRTRKNIKGGECRIGVGFPRFGGKQKPTNTSNSLFNLSESLISGGGCPCAASATASNGPKPMMELPPGVSLGPITANLMKGGGCSTCGSAPKPSQYDLLRGGACGCQVVPKLPTPLRGGYRATKKNMKYLKLWKQGKSIGFTMRSSLKAKGLIPRANGTKRVSPKYR